MTEIKMIKFICIQLLFAFFIGLSGTAVAEEMLIKGEAKYLGWQNKNKENFITCKKGDIPIENGKIESTNEKCPKDGRPVPLAATVTYVDANNRTLRVKNENGEFNFFFPETDEIKSKVKLKDIKIGDNVIITSPIAGRAVAIKIPVVAEKKKLSPAYDKSKDMDNIKDKL
jgi:hypothetical protein